MLLYYYSLFWNLTQENQKIGHRKDCLTAILDFLFIWVTLDDGNSASVAKGLSHFFQNNLATVSNCLHKNAQKKAQMWPVNLYVN